MQRITTLLIAAQLLFFCADCRSQDEIRLLVRGDDIGSTHAPSITDEDGYFYPVIWPGGQFPEERALRNQQWMLEEIEAEMRAQIELARKYIPRISHLSCHMGCSGWDESVGQVYRRLAVEYGLDIPSGETKLERFPLAEKGETLEKRIANFIKGLNKLEPGHTYLFVEHPAVSSPEMEAVGHPGYEDVNEDRDLVRRMFTSDAVKQVIEERHIRLISYADLAE